MLQFQFDFFVYVICFRQLEHIDFDYLGKVVIKLLQNAVEVSAQDPSLRRQLGDAYYAMKQHDKALLEYAEVLLIHQQKITRKEKKEYLNDSVCFLLTLLIFHHILVLLQDRALSVPKEVVNIGLFNWTAEQG